MICCGCSLLFGVASHVPALYPRTSALARSYVDGLSEGVEVLVPIAMVCLLSPLARRWLRGPTTSLPTPAGLEDGDAGMAQRLEGPITTLRTGTRKFWTLASLSLSFVYFLTPSAAGEWLVLPPSALNHLPWPPLFPATAKNIVASTPPTPLCTRGDRRKLTSLQFWLPAERGNDALFVCYHHHLPRPLGFSFSVARCFDSGDTLRLLDSALLLSRAGTLTVWPGNGRFPPSFRWESRMIVAARSRDPFLAIKSARFDRSL
ncbi:hypothetical protein DFH09DRAFT_1078345 [Mycena vulgaris]|nr:hypothetical protein DFH09DRAFT_1078345 [Mycena vulgaris]